jgi:hypothetical protein
MIVTPATPLFPPAVLIIAVMPIMRVGAYIDVNAWDADDHLSVGGGYSRNGKGAKGDTCG